MHPCLVVLVAVDVVQPLRTFALKHLTLGSGKKEIKRSPQDALVGCHPLNALPASQGQCFLRDASFRRPHSFGTEAEESFMRVERPLNLESCVVRMAEPSRGKARSRRRLGPDVGITKQRQNR